MGRTRILIVEDELIIAQDISFKLEDLGYQVVGIATNKKETLDLVEKGNPDLVLLDVELNGEVDGIDIANQLRATTNLPFIYLTSHADISTITRAKETHPKGYILKPIHKKELFASIEMAIVKEEPEKTIHSENDYLFVPHKDALTKVNKNEILWLKAEGNYTKIKTKEERYLVRGNIKEIHTKIGADFCRIHKSYVININSVDKILPMAILIFNQELPIGKMYRENFLNKIQRL